MERRPFQDGKGCAARGFGEGASRCEPATSGHGPGIRWLTSDAYQGSGRPAEAWRRGQQRSRVRMARVSENGRGGSGLDDLSGIHHQDPVAESRDDGQVVADEEHGQAKVTAQALDELQDLVLDGHVQGRGGLVAQQQLGVGGQCCGDDHPLPQPAGELVRPGSRPPLRVRYADRVQQLHGPALGRGPAHAGALPNPGCDEVTDQPRADRSGLGNAPTPTPPREGEGLTRRLILAAAPMMAVTPILAPTRPRPNLDSHLSALFAVTRARSMVAVVQLRDETVFRSFGRAVDGVAPTPRTLVRIGSISKVFAGEVLAALAQEGRLRLTDPVQRFAPAGLRVPPITLVQLATHTAGLPRWANTPVTGPPQAATAARWRWLAAQAGLPTPVRAASYSNIGYDLLGDCLAAAAGEPYVQALARRLITPFRLIDTAPVLPDPRRLLAAGQGASDQRAIAASGGLYSTASDMAGWLRHQLSATPAVRFSQQIPVRARDLAGLERLSNAGAPSGIGLGWLELAAQGGRPRLLQKTGGYGGFMSYTAIAPDRRVGAFVSVPSTSVDTVRALASRINTLLAALS